MAKGENPYDKYRTDELVVEAERLKYIGKQLEPKRLFLVGIMIALLGGFASNYIFWLISKNESILVWVGLIVTLFLFWFFHNQYNKYFGVYDEEQKSFDERIKPSTKKERWQENDFVTHQTTFIKGLVASKSHYTSNYSYIDCRIYHTNNNSADSPR